MICPQCKAEYRAGFTECSDCGVALVTDVHSLPPDASVQSDVSLPTEEAAQRKEWRTFGMILMGASVAIFISSVFLGAWGNWIWLSAAVVLAIGCVLVGKGKGYSAVAGFFALLGPLGIAILLVIPEHSRLKHEVPFDTDLDFR